MSYSLQSFDLATLDTLLISQGVDPIATGLNDFLIGRGDTRGVQDTTSLISVQIGTPPFPVSPSAQVFDITNPGTYSIDTDQYSLQLQAIVLQDTGGPQNLTLTGHSDMLIAAGDGTNTITLQDSGNDIVGVGTGSNTVTGGSGRDSISGAGADDSLVAGSGARSVLYDSGNFATLVGGSGRGDVLVAGGGTDESLVAGGARAQLWGGSGSGDVLFAGRHFHDVTLKGGDGPQEYLYGAGSGDVLYAGGALNSGIGSGTLVAGGNNEQIHIGAHGSDTISGSSSSSNAVFFDSQAYGTGSGITIATGSNGVTTVSFADTGQHFTISGIQTLNFSDGHVVHL